MNLQEYTALDKIEISQNGVIGVREATIIMRNNEEVAKNYHRILLAPGSDVSDMPDNIRAITQVVWTPEVINAYRSQQILAEQ